MLINKQVINEAMKANGEFGQKILRLTQIVYEVNRTIRMCNGQAPIPAFEDAGQAKADSLLKAIIDVWSNCHYSCDIDGEKQHNNWVYAKLKEGWTYGPVEDFNKKQHPNLVPFEQLPWSEKIKDALFLSVVMLARPTADELGLEELLKG
jgi:hypothetical protein